MNNHTIIVLPTFNARNSIVETILKILQITENALVIVVDDNSPDNTAKIIKKVFYTNKRVKIIVREKKDGRGSAVIRGFEEGLKNKDIKYFIEMDADLCHDPKYIKLLIDVCQTYDVAIASKYLKESKIIGLNFKRKLFSRLVNIYLRLLLGIPISDYTNGYRCYRREALEKIKLGKISSKGFIVLTEIAYKIYKHGFSFGEIPITLRQYDFNKSNFNKSEIKEAFLTSIKLRFFYSG